MSRSQYDDNVFLYEVSAVEHWKTRGPILGRMLAANCPEASEVLDVGSGTGLATLVASQILERASFVAVEPSDAMRAALAARIAESGLDGRVTIVQDIEHVAKTQVDIDALLAFGVLGHMDQDERAIFWDVVRNMLVPGGVVAVELMGVEAPTYVANRLAGRRQIGSRVYESWIAGEPLADDEMAWTMTYRVFEGRKLVEQSAVKRFWHTFGEKRLLAEAGGGFSCTKENESMYLLVREE